MTLSIKRDDAVLVMLGSLNPAIFHPEWFARHKLLKPEELEDVHLELTHPQLAKFRIAWLAVEVTQDRLRLSTDDVTNVLPLRDVAQETLALLEHTPVRALGLNRLTHFATGSAEAWNKIGNKLVPKSPFSGVLEDPGTLSASIRGTRAGSTSQHVRVNIGPSSLTEYGVFADFNEHFETKDAKNADFAREVVRDHWESAQDFFEKSARTILERLLEDK